MGFCAHCMANILQNVSDGQKVTLQHRRFKSEDTVFRVKRRKPIFYQKENYF
jgi:hypothetical protein